MTALLEARGVGIAGRLAATDLCAAAGEKVALIGPNGGGKTSLLRALAGVEDSFGAVSIDGILRDPLDSPCSLSLMGASRDIGWPIPVRDLVGLGLPLSDPAAIARLLAQFELVELAERPVSSLSTGERARALMARALAPGAPLLLLDEPLSNLDPYWVLRFFDAMEMEAARGTTLLCALHDLSLVERFDRVLLVAGGALVDDGPPGAVLDGKAFEEAFRIVPGQAGGWAIRPRADPRSSP